MAAYILALIKVDRMTAADVKKRVFPEAGTATIGTSRALGGLSKMVERISSGVASGSLAAASVIDATGTVSSGSIACVQANAAGNYVRFTFGGVNITLTEGTDFLRGASNTTCGANLADAINANAVLKTILSAASVTGTVTCTMRFPTTLGHAVTMSTDDATAFTLTAFASGTQGAAQFFLQGFQANKSL